MTAPGSSRRPLRPARSVAGRWAETRLGALPIAKALFLAIGLGLSFLWGSGKRFAGPSWEGPFSLMPQHAWGMLFVLYGAALIIACCIDLTAVRWVMTVGAIPYAFLGTTFAWAAIELPAAATTGVVAYWAAALAHPIMGELYRK